MMKTIMLSHAVTRRNNERGKKEAERRGSNTYRQSTICLQSPLTDKAGAGKTFVAISLVCKDIERKAGV
jgi:hypothetical protein